jgi:nucleoside-diphosphate-sugar epimerase
MAKILVTGASGLLGTEICKQLKTVADNEVWAVDNHSRSSTIPPCDQFRQIDLNNNNSINILPQDFDYIYHYGAINGTKNFYERPNQVLSNNFICDINMFEYANRIPNLKKIVYASSSEIVSDDPVSPVPEHADITIKNIHNARWSYRIAKVASENYLANSNLPWVMLRYFNVYGSNSKQGHFLGDQIEKIKNGIFSVVGAQETRSFCHVSDAVEASIYVATTVSQQLVNIGNDLEITIGDAVRVIAEQMGQADAIFEQLPSLPGSVTNRRPDISKLKSLMPGYSPISFKEGITRILS